MPSLSRLGLACLAVFIVVLAASAAASPARARDHLDPSFGAHGKVVTSLDLERQWAQVFGESAPNGGVVVAAGKVVVRYLADGRLDPSFGSEGTVHIGEPEGLDFYVGDLVVDPAGGVLLFGTAVDRDNHSSVFYPYPPGTLYTSYAMVLRYDRGGRLDPSFGEGDGIVRTTFGLPQDQTYKVTAATTASAALDSVGRIVMVGGTTEAVSDCTVRSTFGRHDRLLARLMPDGSFDPAFGGGDGITRIDAVFSKLDGLSLTEDGETLLFGSSGPCREATSFLRLTAEGAPDPAPQGSETRFSIGEHTTRGVGQDRHKRPLVLTSRAFLGPRPSYVGSLQRLGANGAPERSFGRKGKATFELPGGSSRPISIELDGRGRIVVTGSLVPSKRRSERRFVLLRFNAAGRRDWKLGPHGRVATGFQRSVHAEMDDLVIDEAGRAVLVGAMRRSAGRGLVLARFVLGP